MKKTHHETKQPVKITKMYFSVNEEKDKIYLEKYKYAILLIILMLGLCFKLLEIKMEMRDYSFGAVINVHNMIMRDIQREKVSYILEHYAEDYETAYRIAKCESQLGKYRENWEGSGATGLFQFKPKTFNYYCEGNIDNDIDQIKCFNKLYTRYPHWWECK